MTLQTLPTDSHTDLEQEAARLLVDPALVLRAKAYYPTFHRLAAPALRTRTNPAYYDSCLPILAYLLAKGFRPGDPEAEVEYDGRVFGAWHLDEKHNKIAIQPGPSQPPVEIPIRKLLAYTRELELHGRNLPLAISLRLGLMLGDEDTPASEANQEDGPSGVAAPQDPAEKTRRQALAVISRATELQDIHHPTLRAHVGRIASRIPHPRGLTLRPYQKLGVAYAILSNYKCLIGDSPGVGKTIEALCALNTAPSQLLPALVVCPASVNRKWARETRIWSPWFHPVLIESGKQALPPPTERTVYIVTWDMLKDRVEDFLIAGIQCLIGDESHRIKHGSSQRSKAFLTLAPTIPHLIMLSGTAMENRPVELYTQMHALDPGAFPTRKAFSTRYANLTTRTITVTDPKTGRPFQRTFDDDSGADNLDELAHRLRGYMIRRLKSEVLKDLPPKTRTSLWTPLPKRSRLVYDRVKAELFTWLCAQFRTKNVPRAAKLFLSLVREENLPQPQAMARALRLVNTNPPTEAVAQMAMVRTGHLRRVVGEAKVPAALQWISDFLESRDTDSPLVVFVEHQKVLKAIGAGLDRLGPSWTYVDGSITGGARDERVQDFQAGRYEVLVTSQALREGVDLFRAADVLFVERWLVPAWEEQAEDRTCRIGQIHPVTIHRLMATETVDEDIDVLVREKREVVAEVLGEESVTESATRETIKGRVASSFAAGLVARFARQMESGARAHAEVTAADVLKYLRALR